TYARDKNLEREAVTDERELMRDALRRGAGQTTFEAIRENFENRQNASESVEVAHQRRSSPSGAWTTQEMLDREQANLQTMRDGNGRYGSIVKEKTIRMIQERGLDGHLNASQRRAVHQILESRDQITGLQGTAGTGKTASLAVVRTAAEHDEYEVHGLAPTTRAAKQLADAGIQSTTLQHLLTRG
ncbi:MAG: AAA family ATPase, partial [bacterium]|nr:AAA family ATPase [bacterium]